MPGKTMGAGCSARRSPGADRHTDEAGIDAENIAAIDPFLRRAAQGR